MAQEQRTLFSWKSKAVMATLDAGNGVFWGHHDRLIPYFDTEGDWR